MSDADADEGNEPPDEFDFSELFGADPGALMAQFMSLLGGGFGGADDLDQAAQIAVSIAAGGVAEPNVDPVDRMNLEQLARVAELQVAKATGLRPGTGAPLSIAPVNRSEWTRRSMQAYRKLIEQLATSMSSPAIPGDMADDPEMAMFEQLFSAIRPLMINMTMGSMLGHLGSRALGTYDIPLPRPGVDELLIVVPNVDEFGSEWSLDRDDLRMWIALSEVAHHAVLSVPHVAERVTELVTRHAAAFRNDPTAITEAVGEIDFDPASLADMQQQIQKVFSDPSAILGAMRSPEQEAILPELGALTATIVGYVDHIMDSLGVSLIGDYKQLTEALRRRRVTASDSDRFVERLLGMELDRQHYDRGRSFVDGVVARAGDEGLARLWESRETLPTPNELDAPGLWLARLGVDFELEVDVDGEFDETDFGPGTDTPPDGAES